ncbi:MAG: shikimate kinase [Candidatus Meridianibacter frigidus]|nr:MAG: shikimate kinase [Candidatus Eremiobacteraeota bacterium]
MRNHLALVGFMASGKSTIGKRLARKLHVPFVDIDAVIEADHGPISDVFYNHGEKTFRKFEHDAIAHALDGEPSVISLGGGAVTFEPSLKLLKKRTYRIFIKVPPEQILGRLRRSAVVRPLLGPQPALHKIKDLYIKRMPLYAHADLTIEAGDLSTPQIVDHIVDWMHRKKIAL